MAFTHYTAFTVQSGQVTGSHSDFPVLLKPTDNRFKTIGNGGHVADTNGYDLRPYSDSGLTSALTYELVPGTYAAATGTFEMWVKVASLAVGSVIYLACGDAALNTDGSSTATWSNGFIAVHHLPDGSTLDLLDSTANNWDGTNSGLTATTGKIDGGINAPGGSGNAFVASSNAITTGQALTFSTWASVTASLGVAVFGKCNVTDGHDWMVYASGSNYFIFVRTVNGSVNINSGVAWSTTLQHVVGTYDGANIRMYVDGAQVGGDAAQTGNLINAADSRLGWSDYALGASPVEGKIDETRVCSAVRSLNWITAEYNNQNAPHPTFTTLGTEQTPGGGGATILMGDQLN